MPRYIEIEQMKLKELTKQVQLFQDDIVCGIGTDFMQKIATAENKLLFDIVKGLATEPTADVVPRSEVERWKNACMHEHNRVCELEQQRFEKLVELVEEAEQEVAKEILNTFASFRALSPNFCKVYNEFEKKYIGE